MSRGPSPEEIAAFLAEVKASRTGGTDPSTFAARKADLLERIAAARPGDQDAAEVARLARAAADRYEGR